MPGAYATYARTAIDTESRVRPCRTPLPQFFGSEHPGDSATELSAADFIRPLFDGAGARPVAEQWGLAANIDVGATATNARIKQMHTSTMRDVPSYSRQPHGVGFLSGHGLQRMYQGVLFTQDWPGLGSISSDCYFAGNDLPSDADVAGLLTFLLGCYTAGCPQLDSFPRTLDDAPSSVAPAPFAAGLVQRLLSYPAGGAAAVLGRVDRAWGFSIRDGSAGRQTGTFRETIARILGGNSTKNPDSERSCSVQESPRSTNSISSEIGSSETTVRVCSETLQRA
jgi:hypothetical protein